MALRIDIKAGEPFVLNNTTMHLTKSAGLIIESRATFIRVKDLVRPDDADTPAKRIYFLCQQIYLHEDRCDSLLPLVKQASGDLLKLRPNFASLLAELDAMLDQSDFYRAMRFARELVERDGDSQHATR